MISDEAKRVRDNTKGTRTVLHEAAGHGDLEIVKFFIEEVGYDVNLRDEDDCTLLFYAAGRGQLETVRYLIKKGADVNATAKTGATALHIAARVGYTEIVKFLLENGADKNAVDNNGYSALDYSLGYDLLAAKLLVVMSLMMLVARFFVIMSLMTRLIMNLINLSINEASGYE